MSFSVRRLEIDGERFYGAIIGDASKSLPLPLPIKLNTETYPPLSAADEADHIAFFYTSGESLYPSCCEGFSVSL